MTATVPTPYAVRSVAGLRPVMLGAFSALLALLVSYVIWCAIEGTFSYSLLINGWLPDAFEIVVASLCLYRGNVRRADRAVALTLGAALMSWALGDLVWTIQTVTGTSTFSNVLGAVLWLGFYPVAYVALVLFIRGSLTALTTPSWLDGAVAGLGTAAVCAAFAFHNVGHLPGATALTEFTNLAYPIGDLLLLALVIGSAALLSGRKDLRWVVLAAACVLNCIGDTFNLFQSSEGQLRIDTIFHALAWPAAGLLMTIAIWLRPAPPQPLAAQKPTGLLLPGLAASAGLVILVAGTITHVSRIALTLAVSSLIAAGFRLVWSAQGLRSLTMQRHRQSMTDELTGLGNRRHLFNVLHNYFSEQDQPHAQRRNLYFLFVDLNRFKEINDSFGHPAGDELLSQLGPRLTGSLAAHDILVRLGGDEFGVVLMDASPDHVTTIAEQLTNRLAEPFALEGLSLTISASIGIACAPTDAHDAAELMACADVAMYRAKLEHVPFAFYQQGVDVGDQWRLGDELRVAITDRQFVLHFQPQLDLTTRKVTGVEALVRWQHPHLGLLQPARFLPLAESAGLMPDLTALLIDIALSQVATWWSLGHEVTVSVNISASNLVDDGFVEMVQQLLGTHHLPAGALVLEITETSVIANFDTSRTVIANLFESGVVVSVDDFGAGFTSLSYLSSLDVRELKLDCKLITGLADEGRDRDRELVRATVKLGHALGLRVVAEGIEDGDTLALLHSFECDVAQGYFVGKPSVADVMQFNVDSDIAGLLIGQRDAQHILR